MPYWRSQLRTRLSPTDVKERLSALTLAPESAYRGLPLRKGKSMYEAATADDGFEFVGVVSDHRFRLNRCGPFDKAFRAEMQGSIELASGGSRIRLTQYLPWRAIAVVSTIALACAFLPLLIDPPTLPSNAERWVFVIVVALMMAGGFIQDAIGNRRRLAELLEATAEPKTSPPSPTVDR